MALDPSIDIDAGTGANLTGWGSVLQSLQDIFSTHFGERVMREWYGSAVPRFLGENMNTQTIVPFFAAISAAIEQWEPRFRVTQVTPRSVGRDGRLEIDIAGEYRPRALLGDETPEGARTVTVSGNSNNWVVG